MGPFPIRRIARGVCRSCAFALLLASPAAQAQAQAAYPHAQAAANAQALAQFIQDSSAAFIPALPALIGARGTAACEMNLGRVFRALDAYALAEAHLRHAFELAMRLGDLRQAAQIAVARGEVALITGHYDRAESVSRELSALARDAQLPIAAATAQEYLGVVDRRRGNLDSALAHQQHAVELQKALGNDIGLATALSNLGTLARDRGDYASALRLHLQALAIRERTRNELELTYRNLALVYRDLGDDAATRKYFAQALQQAQDRGDNTNYAATLGTYAGYLVDVGDFAPALAAAEESLAISRVTGNRPSTGFDLLDTGRALLGLGRIAEAEVRLRESLQLGRELSQHEIIAHAQVALAECALKDHDLARARQLLEATLADPQATQYKPLRVEVDSLREQIASASGEPAKALGFAHSVARLREELLGTRATRRLSALESQHARAAADQQLALALKENQLQGARIQQQRLQRRFGIALLAGLTLLAALLAWRFAGVRRLNRALALRNAEIEAQRAALGNANERLRQQTDELYQAAITDPLTGVFNRGHLMRQLDARIADCNRNGTRLALLLIDFDHFKQINDAHGHLFGDRVLVAGVQTLRQWLEPGDLLGRYGGEEFVVASSVPDAAAAQRLAERLRLRVAETLAMFASDVRPLPTISIGIGMLGDLPAPVRVEDLIEAADKAVYRAKAEGRNRVVAHAN